MTDPNLSGLRVLLTRTAQKSQGLAQRIESLAGIVRLAPCLDIEPLAINQAEQLAIKYSLQCANIVIFISPNAVAFAHGQQLLGSLGAQYILAPGQGTAKMLYEAGIDQVTTPQSGSDSEALLRLDVLSRVSGRRVCIVRGQGGRETLRETLLARGASVKYIEVYRRTKAFGAKVNISRAFAQGVDVMVAHSGETFQVLQDSIESSYILKHGQSLPIFLPSQRVAGLARRSGYHNIHVFAPPNDDGIVNGLLKWRSNRGA